MRSLMMIPTREKAGLNTTVIGMARSLSVQGVKVCTLSLVYDPSSEKHRLPSLDEVPNYLGIPLPKVKKMFSSGQLDAIVEAILRISKSLESQFDVVVIQGVKRDQAKVYATKLNAAISRALSAEVILVTTPEEDQEFTMAEQIAVTARPFGGENHRRVLGAIINKAGQPEGLASKIGLNKLTIEKTFSRTHKLPVIATIPWQNLLSAPRCLDLAKSINATALISRENQGQARVQNIVLCSNRLETLMPQFENHTLAIVDSDRYDVILAIALNAIAQHHLPQMAGLILAGETQLPSSIEHYLQLAAQSGFAIYQCQAPSHSIYVQLMQHNNEVPLDDAERIHAMGDHVLEHIDRAWLDQWIASKTETFMTPVSFQYQLIEKAKQAAKTIVLPEGDEPRTLQAAAACAQKSIARIILLGDPSIIQEKANSMGLDLSEGIEILDPKRIADQYLQRLLELRAHKNLSEPIAREQLQDRIMLGTLMLEAGDVDGLVSGAAHTTAHTIRPALQLIKAAPHRKLVSSIFFMCLPDQVLVYGDCAVNPSPNAEELADIAISSADSAKQFGINPKIAMISYSTGNSGRGSDVEKVKQATQKVKALRPDLLIDGPLQYDAALIESVAAKKAPNSPVAGHANVIIFPDLNTGNTTYKAVQRSADALSMGPMLQGLAKPVNDLSRGATVEDIVYTIALTAIQGIDHC